MALPPTGSGSGPRIPDRPQTRPGRLQRPVLPRSNETPTAPPAGRPRRLATAISAADIEAQIERLLALIANDNINPKAPPGSYLNMLV